MGRASRAKSLPQGAPGSHRDHGGHRGAENALVRANEDFNIRYFMRRREFLKSATFCGAAGAVPAVFAQEKTMAMQKKDSINQIPLTTSVGTRKGDMLYRTLGHTGEK